jgi:transposase-like protein
MSVLKAPHFRDDDAARTFLESLRWPNGPVCPHCGMIGKAYRLKQPGRLRCAEPDCRKDFTVTTKTAMEGSHIPLHKWMVGFYLMNASKKAVSAKQLERTLGITYRSAWFMAHRIREAMASGGLTPMGSGGGIVEADETYIGRRRGVVPAGGGFGHKMKVMSLVERGREVRSIVLDKVTREAVERVIRENVSREARLMTDTAPYYKKGGFDTASHEMVNHYRGEYALGHSTPVLSPIYSPIHSMRRSIVPGASERPGKD